MLKPQITLKSFAAMLLLSAALAACAAQPDTSPSQALVLENAPVAIRNGYPIEHIKQANACFDIKLEYPFLGRPELDQQVRRWVDENYYDVSEEMHGMCASSPGDSYKPYKYNVTYELFSTPGSISVVFKSWAYTGGAHGQDGIQTLTLAVPGGEELRYGDIFADTEDLYIFIADYVYSALQPKLGDIWQRTPMFTEGLEPVEGSFKNFAITPKGLTIYFPSYQIAPFSEGQQLCEVPLGELLRFKPKPGIWQ